MSATACSACSVPASTVAAPRSTETRHHPGQAMPTAARTACPAASAACSAFPSPGQRLRYRFVLAVIQDITEDGPRADLADLARAAAAAEYAHRGRGTTGELHIPSRIGPPSRLGQATGTQCPPTQAA